MGYSIGDKVKWRGSQMHSAGTVRGVIETIDPNRDGGDIFGVRLENGNFKWSVAGQLFIDTGA